MVKNYKVNGKIFEVDLDDLKEIKKDALCKMTDEEAVRCYFEEMEIITNPNEPIVEVQVPKQGRTYAKSDKPRKPTTRERKVNENKKVWIDKVNTFIVAQGIETKVKTETEIDFEVDGRSYTFKLIEHRQKKGQPTLTLPTCGRALAGIVWGDWTAHEGTARYFCQYAIYTNFSLDFCYFCTIDFSCNFAIIKIHKETNYQSFFVRTKTYPFFHFYQKISSNPALQ